MIYDLMLKGVLQLLTLTLRDREKIVWMKIYVFSAMSTCISLMLLKLFYTRFGDSVGKLSCSCENLFTAEHTRFGNSKANSSCTLSCHAAVKTDFRCTEKEALNHVSIFFLVS